jgi:hypothetical protein
VHIEMAAFKLLGDLLKGTGWVTALSEADIASLGTTESFLTVSNLAKTRQAHQITACCLYDLIKKAYQHATAHKFPAIPIVSVWQEQIKVGHKPSQAFVLDSKRMLPPSLYPWHALLWLLNEPVLAISASMMKC